MLRRWGGCHRIATWIGVVGITAVITTSCGTDDSPGRAVPGGDAERGRVAFVDYGCMSCHTVADLPDADANVGPNLDGLAERRIIAGSEPNRPEVLIQWLQDPQSIRPGTAMPDTGVTEQDARDIAAYLYSQ